MDVERITKNEFRPEYLDGCTPILITDGAQDWPAVKEWSPDTLKSKAAKRNLPIAVSDSGRWEYTPDNTAKDPNSQYRLLDVPFHQAADWIIRAAEGGPKYYISPADIRGWPELMSDLDFFQPPWRGPINLWFGSAGTVTSLHYDRANNLYAQIYGSKRFTIFPSEQTPKLYQYPANCALSNFSFVDVENPNFECHPLFREAEPITIELHPAELLYLPAFWWHHVRSTTSSISVNQWWSPALKQHCGANARRVLVTEYIRDRWENLRGIRGLTRQRLIDEAQHAVTTSLAAAVLGAAVALDDWQKWNKAINGTAIESLAPEIIKEKLSMMVADVLDSALEHLRTDDVEVIIAQIRRIIGQ